MLIKIVRMFSHPLLTDYTVYSVIFSVKTVIRTHFLVFAKLLHSFEVFLTSRTLNISSFVTKLICFSNTFALPNSFPEENYLPTQIK